MTPDDESSAAGAAVLEREYLPEVAFVAEGELHVPLDYDDDAAQADSIFAGFRYLLLQELRKHEPALMRLYDLEFFLEEVLNGSRIYRWKVIARLKRQVSKTLESIRRTAKPEVVIGIIGLIMATPPTVESIEHLLRERAAPAAEHRLQQENPHAPPQVSIIIVRPPDQTEQLRKYQSPDFPGESQT